MFCKNCGEQMPDDGTFCPNCGKSTKEASGNLNNGSNGTTKKGSLPKIAVIGGVVAVLIVGVVFAMQIGKNKGTNSVSNNSSGGEDLSTWNTYQTPEMNSNNSSGGEDLSTQIQKAKCVTDYSKDTTVDQMDTVTFGSYPQSDKTGNTKDPIEWIVLDRKDGKALLLSKYILDCIWYNNKKEDFTWQECDLRFWLNDEFINIAFSKSEQKNIVETKVKNKDNKKSGTKGGEDTKDKIFCLSIGEVEKYFKQSDMEVENFRLATKGTKYAKETYINGKTLYVKSAGWYKGNSYFRLRSPGYYQYNIAGVMYDGSLDSSGHNVVGDLVGVRPALWVSY